MDAMHCGTVTVSLTSNQPRAAYTAETPGQSCGLPTGWNRVRLDEI